MRLHRPSYGWWREPAWLAGACVVFWWLRIYQPSGERVQVFANFDALMYWIPLLREAALSWRSGSVPLWNPYQALGTPLLATQQVAAAYPLNALYLFLDAGTAWLLTGLLHHLLAAVGMYAFARTLGLQRRAALVGGMTYAFSAVVIGAYVNLPDELICVAWLPAMFACAEQLIARPTASATATLAGIWALHILGGDADTVTRAAELLGAYVAVRVCTRLRDMPRSALAAALASAAAAGLALLLTAWQWAPTVELAHLSVRDVGTLTLARQSGFAADPWQFFTTRARGIPTASIGGSIPLVLASIGWWCWPRRSVAWFFGVAAVCVVLLAAGPATPLFDLWRQMPTGTWFRVPMRLLNLLPICLAPLAASGTEQLFVQTRGDGMRAARAGIVSVLGVLAIKAAIAARSEVARAWLVGTLFDGLPMLLVAAFVSLTRRRPRSTVVGAGPVMVALLISIVPTALYQPDTLSPSRAATLYGAYAGVFTELQPQAPARVLSLLPVGDGRMWAKLGTYFRVPVLNDFEPLSLSDFQRFTTALRGAEAPTFAALLDVFTGDVAPPRARFDARLLNLSGVRFVVANAATESRLAEWFEPGTPLVVWKRSGHTVVYENRAALPRALFVQADRIRVARDDCVAALRESSFDPARDVLLAAPVSLPAATADLATATVHIAEYTPQMIRIAATAEQPGVVVLTDAFYPGWTARVDGRSVPILRGDCFFRAVAVGPGTHDIVLRYRPQSFRVGLYLSGIGFGILVLVLVRRWARRR